MPRKKFTKEKVLRIAQSYQEGQSLADVAVKEGVGHTSVWRIATGRLFSDLTGIPEGTPVKDSKPKRSKSAKPEDNMSRARMRSCLYKKSANCMGTFLSLSPGVRCCDRCRETLMSSGDW